MTGITGMTGMRGGAGAVGPAAAEGGCKTATASLPEPPPQADKKPANTQAAAGIKREPLSVQSVEKYVILKFLCKNDSKSVG